MYTSEAATRSAGHVIRIFSRRPKCLPRRRHNSFMGLPKMQSNVETLSSRVPGHQFRHYRTTAHIAHITYTGKTKYFELAEMYYSVMTFDLEWDLYGTPRNTLTTSSIQTKNFWGRLSRTEPGYERAGFALPFLEILMRAERKVQLQRPRHPERIPWSLCAWTCHYSCQPGTSVHTVHCELHLT
jgi:hypothetical protein